MSAFVPNTTNNTAILSAGFTLGATQVITIMCWLKLNTGTPAAYRDIVSLDPNIYLQTFSDGTTIDFGTANTDNTVFAATPNVWYHVCGVFVPTSTTARRIYGYVNGDLRINVANTDTFTTYTNICVGNSITYTYSFPMNGNVKDVKVWSRDLSPNEITDEIQSKIPVHKAGLLLWAPLDDSLTSDKSGNGYTFTAGSNVTLQSGPLQPYPRKKRII